jgi:hypothetical protein
MSLLALTSPAKGMNEDPDWSDAAEQTTQPCHLETAVELVEHLRSRTQDELQNILDVSDDLTELNYERFQDWSAEHTADSAKPAILLYDGQVYKMFDASAFSSKQQQHAQRSLRIISGLYGLLRPYDLIQPYRLEMRTPLDYVGDQSLAAYWEERITSALQDDVEDTGAQAVINLASNEYRKAVDADALAAPLIDIDFKEQRDDGSLRTVAIYAKKARGAMLGYIVEQQVESVEELERFDLLGYQLKERDEGRLLFTRSQ